MSRWKAVIHLHKGIPLNHKKEGNFNFCDSMEGPGEYYAKWNTPVRENKNYMISLLYMESNVQNKLTNKIETES